MHQEPHENTEVGVKASSAEVGGGLIRSWMGEDSVFRADSPATRESVRVNARR